MDFRYLIFPFVMAVITNSLMILITFFLRKSKYFANLFGIGYLLGLYFLCIARIVVPIEFRDIQIYIRDPYVYNFIMEVVLGRLDITKNLPPMTVIYILLGVWLTGSGWFLYSRMIRKEVRFKKKVSLCENHATKEEQALLDSISKQVFQKEKRITLNRTVATKYSMVTGFFSHTILIPDIEFTQTELEMILRHECIHIKNKDIWIRTLIEVYCILFWWNPFSYLLYIDIDDTLENKCDLNVVKTFENTDKLLYAQTVSKFMAEEDDKDIPFIHSRFSTKRKSVFLKKHANYEAKQRIIKILGVKIKKNTQMIFAIIIGILFTSVFVVSYIFIWQPYAGWELDSEQTNFDNISNTDNSYLIKQDDGNYIFYFLGNEVEKVPKEEVEQGLYRDYPIYEK